MEREDTTTLAHDKSWTVIGLMSGTSLDGLDIARGRFDLNDDGEWSELETVKDSGAADCVGEEVPRGRSGRESWFEGRKMFYNGVGGGGTQ